MALMKYREQNQVLWRGVRPAHKGTQVLKNASVTDGEIIIYTVPPGKILYLLEAHLRLTDDVSGQGVIYIFTDVPGWLRNLCSFWFASGSSGGTDHFVSAYPLEIPAGYTIRLFSEGAGFDLQAGIFGWVE